MISICSDTDTASLSVYMDVVLDVVPPERCRGSIQCQSNFRDGVVKKFQDTPTFTLTANTVTGEPLPVALKLVYLIAQDDKYSYRS